MDYNNGKSFDILRRNRLFLSQAMDAAAAVADQATLTDNSHVMNPAYGQVYGWNPYFEMFSTTGCVGINEVLLWKQYNGA